MFERREKLIVKNFVFKNLDFECGENINFKVDVVVKFCGSKKMGYLFLRELGK